MLCTTQVHSRSNRARANINASASKLSTSTSDTRLPRPEHDGIEDWRSGPSDPGTAIRHSYFWGAAFRLPVLT